MNSFFARRYVIQGIFIAVAIILLIRLFYIQVVDNKYLLSANNNVLRKVIVYPARGVILDRKGEILVQNEPVYDLMITPREVKPFDTLEFCKLIDIDKPGFDKRFKKAKSYSPYRASIFEKQLSARIYASFQEKLSGFPGFFVQKRTVRRYPDSTAAQFLGYIGEVSESMIEKSGGFYRQGDYIGISGVEKAYEELLRGQRGVQNLMVDAFNRPKGHFADGKYDTLAVPGEKLISSLDRSLQKLGEDFMQNKIGSVVAIEPATGEILAFVSSPGYDPNLMVGRERGNNYMKFLNDPYKPMFIRPTQAEYPPGSIFKIINALVGQQSGLLNTNTVFPCGGGYRYGNRIMRCTHVHPPLNLTQSIQFSCNAYYGYAYNRMIDHAGVRPVNAYKNWRGAVAKFNVGSKLDIDLPNERKGLLPTADMYTKLWGSNKWASNFNISLSIGQGELGITPLQMANIMAIVANRGFYFKPHLIKAIGEKEVIKKEYTKKNYAGVDAPYFEPVIEGMSRVVNQPGGTAYYYGRIPNVEMCGKTGTVQNPHGEDHAVFVGFAPRDNPKIAIAVVVENAGFGGIWAGPIASMMAEFYLTDTIARPKIYKDRILNTSFIGGKMILNKPETIVKKDSAKTKKQVAKLSLPSPKVIGKNE